MLVVSNCGKSGRGGSWRGSWCKDFVLHLNVIWKTLPSVWMWLVSRHLGNSCKTRGTQEVYSHNPLHRGSKSRHSSAPLRIDLERHNAAYVSWSSTLLVSSHNIRMVVDRHLQVIVQIRLNTRDHSFENKNFNLPSKTVLNIFRKTEHFTCDK